MLLLDTNVISELRKVSSGKADAAVAAWEKTVPVNQSFLSAITIFELEIGILRLERRDPMQALVLRKWFDALASVVFYGRILPVDSAVAKRAAAMHVPDRRPDRDAFIAATALEHGMTIATRNTADFTGTGALLTNPWQAK